MESGNKVMPHFIGLKAGMNSINSQSIAKLVAQMTKGTPKDLHQKQLQKRRSLQVAQMLEKIMKYSSDNKLQIKLIWQKKIVQMEKSRPLHKYWGHFDFDMFYVACELLSKPEWKDLPCAVGGQNSVLCTANYAARLFGVRSAMPTFVAKKLCPQLILIKPNFQKYRTYSNIFRDILRRFDMNLESMGLDEAYVDLTQHLTYLTLAQQQNFISKIRQQIYDASKLTVSCGVGPNKMIAKMASQVNKPNGQCIVQNDSEIIKKFMADKKIRKIPGIGPVNDYYLKGLNIECANDLIQNIDILSICFSQKSCEFFVSAALGLGQIEHDFKQRKSVGKSQTFRPTVDKQFLQAKLLQLSQQVSRQLQQLGYLSNNVVISYQSENYQKKQKTLNLQKFTKQGQTLFNATLKVLKESVIQVNKKIRLLGVKCTNLIKIEQWKKNSLQAYFSKQRQQKKQKAFQKQQQKSHQNNNSSQMNNKKPKQKTSKPHEKQTKLQQIIQNQNMEHKSKNRQLLNEIKQKSQFMCPICSKQVQCMNNLSAFNRHIDKCLKSQK